MHVFGMQGQSETHAIQPQGRPAQSFPSNSLLRSRSSRDLVPARQDFGRIANDIAALHVDEATADSPSLQQQVSWKSQTACDKFSQKFAVCTPFTKLLLQQPNKCTYISAGTSLGTHINKCAHSYSNSIQSSPSDSKQFANVALNKAQQLQLCQPMSFFADAHRC